jgi:hypothetical protein
MNSMGQILDTEGGEALVADALEAVDQELLDGLDPFVVAADGRCPFRFHSPGPDHPAPKPPGASGSPTAWQPVRQLPSHNRKGEQCDDNGLSLETFGLECDLVTPRSAIKTATDLAAWIAPNPNGSSTRLGRHRVRRRLPR